MHLRPIPFQYVILRLHLGATLDDRNLNHPRESGEFHQPQVRRKRRGRPHVRRWQVRCLVRLDQRQEGRVTIVFRCS